MKKIALSAILVLLAAQMAYGVKAYFHHAPFYAPAIGPYVETYLAIDPTSVGYTLNANEKLQASVEVTMLFYNGDEIREYRKYNILGPELTPESEEPLAALIDLQRIPISDGAYNFELHIRDNTDEDSTVFTHKEIMVVEMPIDQLAFSGIEPAEQFVPAADAVTKYTKSGLEIVPFVSSFYPETMQQLSFYCELYNVDKEVGPGEGFLLRYYVSSIPSRRVFESTVSFERRQASPIVVITKSVNIKDLPSGNYNLEVEVRNSNNELLISKKHFFQRANHLSAEPEATDYAQVELEGSWVLKYATAHELAPHVKSLYPIASKVERGYIGKDFTAADLETMQRFFLNFWESRNKIAPESDWELYRQQVEMVDRLYGNQVKRGYMTDRGRVYLQYGSPNQIVERKRLSHFLPYEIWHYYHVNNESNRRFVFCLTNIGTNDYELIHSDLTGEIATEGWRDIMRGGHMQPTDAGQSSIRFEDEYEQLRRDYRQ